jgi:hypothetical protein
VALNDTFKAAAVIGRKVFSSVFKTGRYVAYGSSVYDASAGVASTIATSVANVPILFNRYDKRLVDGNSIQPGDIKGLLAQSDLSVTPRNRDQYHVVIDGASTVFEVENVGRDAAEATWELQLRKP